MPIYEYGCQQCGHDFEEMQKFSDPPVERCPECGSPEAQRKVSVSAFHLKGGGWYKDGYGSKSTEEAKSKTDDNGKKDCLLYTSPSPRDRLLSRMPSSA